jgi:predicted transposase YbfD/YdcC
MEPQEFEKAFQAWVHDLAGTTAGKHIAIDGKTLRRSFDKASKKAAIHMVSAWVHENHAVFGQLKVDDKTNEIKAIPKLLEILNLKGATVTIDAMGCQREISSQIVDKDGDYVLALKGNQGQLHEDVVLFMNDAIEKGSADLSDVYESCEKGHGRIEQRMCWTSTEVDWLRDRHAWPSLSSIAAVECRRTIDGNTNTERRYFISSHDGRCAQRIATVVRNHWRVEAQLHWTLDVCFGEDNSRVRIENAAENLSRVRRIALMLLKQEKTARMGVKGKRMKAAYDKEYLLKVLNF